MAGRDDIGRRGAARPLHGPSGSIEEIGQRGKYGRCRGRLQQHAAQRLQFRRRRLHAGARQQYMCRCAPGPRVQQAAEGFRIEAAGQQGHAGRALQHELLAGAQHEDQVVLQRMTLHPGLSGATAMQHRKADLAGGQAALLHHALAHPFAEHMQTGRGRLDEGAAHQAGRQLDIALRPLGRRGAMQVEVVEDVEADRHAGKDSRRGDAPRPPRFADLG
ncbi:hypothetical protein ACS5PN_04035 [Roseateles sp. NT4]|uniref:hypothetical protein n=1 Tax=Roseateles sp. NT4 TaxID=3453715 RepID=UPI003EEAFEA8